jgi:isocitrate/isopropylmalate dehydrogenase
MYGDMVAELGAGLIGGTGVAPGGHFGGADGRELAVFEATHGTAPSLAGTDTANPVGLLLSGAMLLRFIEEDDAADRLHGAVVATLEVGDVTADIASDGAKVLGTRAFTESVIGRL